MPAAKAGSQEASQHECLHLRRRARKERALERQAARALRSPQQQLEFLAARGFTRGREVERLRKLIAEQVVVEEPAAEPALEAKPAHKSRPKRPRR